MNKASHKRKVKKARKMMTKVEIKNHTTVFGSKAWDKQKQEKAAKVKKQAKKFQVRKIVKKKNKKAPK